MNSTSLAEHNDRADRLRTALDHYLDLGRGLRAGDPERDERAIWPCPTCGRGSFVARFEEGVAGCVEEGCEVPSEMELLELVAYLDAELATGDTRRATERFSEIFEAALKREQQREEQRKERRRTDRQRRRQRAELAGSEGERPQWSQEKLL
jgi:hypothetical protein